MLGQRSIKTGLAGAFAFVCVWFFYHHNPLTNSKMATDVDWKTLDLKKRLLPSELNELTATVKVNQSRVAVMGHEVFYRSALPPAGSTPSGLSVLLLHGKSFKSQTWLELNTIHLLAAMGHKVVAVDLPGYGESSQDPVLDDKRGQFLEELINNLNLTKPVVVSPSLSGAFTTPLLNAHSEILGGYIPVAPIHTDEMTAEQYQEIEVPTLALYGERDSRWGNKSMNDLKHIPTSQVFMLPNAGHAAYLDQPLLFHQLLYNFLLALK